MSILWEFYSSFRSSYHRFCLLMGFTSSKNKCDSLFYRHGLEYRILFLKNVISVFYNFKGYTLYMGHVIMQDLVFYRTILTMPSSTDSTSRTRAISHCKRFKLSDPTKRISPKEINLESFVNLLVCCSCPRYSG